MATKKDRRDRGARSMIPSRGYGIASYGWPGPFGLGMRDSDRDGIPDHQDPTPYGGGGAGNAMLSGAQFSYGPAGVAGDSGGDAGGADGGGGDGGA